MIGVYCIINKINGHRYIGASKHIEERITEHWRSSSDDDRVIYRAIRKYGRDNFIITILEETTLENMYKQEIYWINYYDSFYNGYNMNEGGVGGGAPGEINGRAILKNEDVIDIRTRYWNFEHRIDVYQLYKDRISFGGFCAIWQGENWKHIMPEIYTTENILKHTKRKLEGRVNIGEKNGMAKLSEDDVTSIIALLQYSSFTQTYIAQLYKVSYNTINEINRCLRWKHLHNYTHNIRKEFKERGGDAQYDEL